MRLTRLVLGLFWVSSAAAQELPENEVQVTFNSYFDSSQVAIVYPTVSGTRQVAERTAVSARYLVDVISAASIRSRFDVEGVTSATSNEHGADEGFPDEVRHEFGAGVTQLVWRGNASANVLRSVEHDYSSNTVAVNVAQSFAARNTDVLLGFVRSWDHVYPQTRNWRRDKHVTSVSAGLSQVFSRRAIGQVEFSYSKLDGLLSDPYQVVTIYTPQWEALSLVEPRHPEQRIRRAVGARANVMTGEDASVRLGYRRYWDSWDVRSDTFDVLVQRNLADRDITVGLAGRRYLQSRAEFFEERYTELTRYRAVDAKLNANRSSEIQLRLRIAGRRLGWLPGASRDGLNVNVALTYYRRRSNSPDWHSRRDVLTAIVSSVGFRYRY